MFSKNQIISLISEYAPALPEGLADWYDSLKNKIEWDNTNSQILISNEVLFDAPVIMNEETIHVDSFGDIVDSDENTLQDKLDEKQDLFPTDLSEIEKTFSDTPTLHQLPSTSQSNLTTEQKATIKANMLYWMKRGYINNGDSIIKISYNANGESPRFIASYTIYDGSGEVDEFSQYDILLQGNSYICTITLM